MPILDQASIDRIDRVVHTVEARFDNMTDADIPVLQQNIGDDSTSSIFGVLDEDLTYHGQATVSVYSDPTNESSDTGDNVEANTWLLVTGKKLASGDHVEMVSSSSGIYRVIASRECPV